MPGGGDDRHSEQRPTVELRPRVLEAAAAARERERAPLRNEDLLHLDVLAAGAAEAPGLVEAEQARLVQQLLVLGQQHARVLAFLRALEERRHALARAAHRLFVADAGEAHFRKSSTSRRGGSSATAISFSIARPHPGQQNWRNCGCGSMKRFGSPTIGFDASIGRSLRTQPSL